MLYNLNLNFEHRSNIRQDHQTKEVPKVLTFCRDYNCIVVPKIKCSPLVCSRNISFTFFGRHASGKITASNTLRYRDCRWICRVKYVYTTRLTPASSINAAANNDRPNFLPIPRQIVLFQPLFWDFFPLRIIFSCPWKCLLTQICLLPYNLGQ